MSNPNLYKGKTKRFDFLDKEQEVVPEIVNNDVKAGTQPVNSVNAWSATGFAQESSARMQPEVDSQMLLEDGVYRNSKRVLPRHSKLGNEMNYMVMDGGAGQDEVETSREGVKKNPFEKTDLRSLRSKMGFNWQKASRKFAITGIIVALGLVLVFTGVAAWAINRYNDAPNITEGSLFNLKENSVVYARDGKTKIFEFFNKDQKREYVTIDKIPEVMQLAILGLEDENFYYNPDGIPWSSIVKAVFECVQGGFDDCRGASGLSQQLVKNVNDDRDNTTDRKIRELFTAIKLSNEGTRADGKKVNKSDILELYLNFVEFSRNSKGVQAASRSYFGHDIDARENPADPNSPLLLTPPKACYLAALVQQPSRFASSINSPESPAYQDFINRKDNCLYKLAGDGENFSLRGDGKPLFIPTLEEYEKWKATEVVFVDNKVDDPYPHFREYVDAEVTKFLEAIGLSREALFRQGLKITTTLDTDIQKKTQDIIQNARKDINKAGGNNAAGIVLDGPTGEIRAMVGSLDYNDKTIDGSVNVMLTPQQPGSSIKPVVYANLFDKGFNPGTVIMDTKTKFIVDPKTPNSTFEPSNFGDKYRGPVSTHYALSNSLNIPAVKAGYLGAGAGNYDLRKSLDSFFDFSEKIGDRYDDGTQTGAEADYRSRCYSGTFIGGCEVYPIAHTTAINTLLQEGNLRTSTPFISIKDKNGRELYTPENRQLVYPVEDKVIKPEVAKQIEWIMSDQDRPEFGQFKSFFTIPGWNLAAKTGTTDENVDTWTVGGSPLYTTVLWAGRTDNKPLNKDVQASNVALPIWQNIQKVLHEGIKPVSFSSQGLKEVKLDRISGFPSEGGVRQLLSDDQIRILQEAGAKIAKPDFDPRKTTMYEYRSAVIQRKLKINKSDGKLAVEGKTLPENIEEKTCYDFLSEFPGVPNWREPVDAWSRNAANKCGDVTISDQDQIKDRQAQPTINVNGTLETGKPMSQQLGVSFATGAASKKITRATIKVNGLTVKSFSDAAGLDQASLTMSASEASIAASGAASATISLEVQDSTGSTNSLTVNNVGLTGTDAGSGNAVSLEYPTEIAKSKDAVLRIKASQPLTPMSIVLSSGGQSVQCAANPKSTSPYVYECKIDYSDMAAKFNNNESLNISTSPVLPGLTTNPIKFNK